MSTGSPIFAFWLHPFVLFVVVCCCVLRFHGCPSCVVCNFGLWVIVCGQKSNGLCVGQCASCLVSNLDGSKVRFNLVQKSHRISDALTEHHGIM